MALIVQHDHEGIGAEVIKHGVAAERSGNVRAGPTRLCDGRRDDLDLLATEQAAFSSMRIEPAYQNLRHRYTEVPERGVGSLDRSTHAVERDKRERPSDTDVQRAMHDASIPEPQHHEDVVHVHPSYASDGH